MNTKIYAKLLEVQKEIGTIKKYSVNPNFKNRYFDINTLLAEVKPVLNKHGLVLTQALAEINGRLAIKTAITNTEDLEEISSIAPLPECADAQKYGSAITYFRRYSLQSLLALEAEDDDANLASNKVTPKSNYVANKAAKDSGQDPLEAFNL